MHAHIHEFHECIPFPVCLYLIEKKPRKSEVKLQLSYSLLNVEVWHCGLVEEGSKNGESE